jgi:SAM-dependent methyltransferase
VRSPDSFAPRGLLRALAYRVLWSGARTLNRAGDACLFLAAGLLRQDDLNTASRLYWPRYATSADDVDAGLEVWEHRLYSSLLRPSDRVLLAGCGAGRDLLALRELGYDVTGLDPMPELIDEAHKHLARRGLTSTIRQGFIETTDIDGTYDVVILGGCCYCYVPCSASRVATLARIKAHLSEEGRIVVTFAGLNARSRLAESMTRMVGCLTRGDWHVERGDTFSRGYLVPGLLRYEHSFRPGEVARECTEAGFRVVQDEATTRLHYVVAR